MNEVIDASARRATTITPSDTVVLTPVIRSLYIGVTGNVAVETIDGDSVIFVAVPAGAILPVQCRLVKATGTTATTMIGLHD